MKIYIGWLGYAAFFVLVFVVLGELDFRLKPKAPHHLRYEVHDELLWRLAPGQVGHSWMAQLTRLSPIVTINSLGLRGPEVDPANHRYVVLAVGSSQALGIGNEDDETWTARLEAELKGHGLDAVVLNGASPGWGPWQHALYLRRYAEPLRADLMLVLVSAGDTIFMPRQQTEAEKKRMLEESRQKREWTNKMLALSSFLVFSLRKAQVLWVRTSRRINASMATIRRALRPPQSSTANTTPDELQIKRRIQRNEPYWKDINAYSISSNRALVFLVLNPTEQPIARAVLRTLQELTSNNPRARVVELDYRTLGLLSIEDARQHYLARFTFPNDAHPNALYNGIIGQHVAPTVESLLLEGER